MCVTGMYKKLAEFIYCCFFVFDKEYEYMTKQSISFLRMFLLFFKSSSEYVYKISIFNLFFLGFLKFLLPCTIIFYVESHLYDVAQPV